MRISRALLLLWAVLPLATCAFGKDAVTSQSIIETPHTVGTNQTLAAFVTGAITRPSPGVFNYPIPMRASQTNGTGWGRSAEYRKGIWGRNFAGLLYSETPTNATLYVPRQKPFTWPISRYEFDMLFTHEFAPIHRRLTPYITSGAGAIALNGHPSESGWDGQWALVGGTGGDIRLSRFVTLRAGFTVDGLKASTYSDRSYRSRYTVMVEPRIGFVWAFGLPHPR